ncbi:MAG: hypothetical protein KatS3mg101_0641 [Patescibacteria group bacterium]|nr:MAG: hypothetical protein KatS3mg101_0641 [Patescibacteria group bacterium]
MAFRTKRKVVIFLAITFAFGVGFVVLIRLSSPKLSYQIKTSIVDDAPQIPLEVAVQPRSLSFVTKFYDLTGNFNAAQLKRTLKFQQSFPFLVVDPNITVVLTEQEVYEEESFVYYEISGSVKNLKPGDYKFSIVDMFGNLIDETFVTVPGE